MSTSSALQTVLVTVETDGRNITSYTSRVKTKPPVSVINRMTGRKQEVDKDVVFRTF